MKVRLLKKLRKQAQKKYTIEPRCAGKHVLYWIMLNCKNEEPKMLIYKECITDAIRVRNKLRRNDILENVGIIRYRRTIKQYK